MFPLQHGGGYSYRLAPATGPLTEEAFGKMPLDFVGQQSLRYSSGQQIWFNGTYVTEGTTPKGSMWSRNPIPRNDIGGSGVGFAPPCLAYGLDASQCQGEGDGGTALVNFEIVDRIVIPAGTPPGAYVLGWRWSVISPSVCWQRG
eukprot:COSAG01_NODE_311_length_19072_cov_73.511727_12_plen_145_part_00